MDYFDIRLNDEERMVLLKMCRDLRSHVERNNYFENIIVRDHLNKLDALVDKLDL